jgi:hypothetical protein
MRFALAIVLASAVSAMLLPRPWNDPTLFQSAIFALAIVQTTRRVPLRFSFPMLPLAIAIVWGLVQFAANSTASRAETRVAILTWAANLAAFCLARQIRGRFLDFLLWFAALVAVVSIAEPKLAPFANFDHHAAFLEMLLPLALIRTPILGAAMYASVIARGSRAGAILVTLEWIAVLALRRRSRAGGLKPAPLPVWVLAVAFVAVAGGNTLWHRFQDPHPYEGRREILSGATAMVAAKPWSGFGLGTFPTVYQAFNAADFGTRVEHAHNAWVEWAAEGGIPFAFALAAIAIWAVPRAVRSVWGIGLIAIFLHSLVDYPLQVPAIELWLFALLGALAAASDVDTLQHI